jgi:putative ABC transport system permease protein
LIDRADVSPEYFHLLGIPLLRGRLFSDSDNDTAPQVAVINETMARMYWPNSDPLGRRFRISFTSPWDSRAPTDPARQYVTVVGIVADARTESLDQRSVPQIYLDAYQTNSKELAVFLRGQLDTAAIPEQVRTLVQSVNPELPVYGPQTLDDAVSASLAERRLSMEIVACFAVTALLLAALGIYGTISYVVSARTREIGIRLALGAHRGRILAMVLRQGLVLAIAGAALGVIGALIVGRLMAGLLYGVTPHDPLTFVGVTLVLSGVALLACYIPARRATRVDPLVALHYE